MDINKNKIIQFFKPTKITLSVILIIAGIFLGALALPQYTLSKYIVFFITTLPVKLVAFVDRNTDFILHRASTKSILFTRFWIDAVFVYLYASTISWGWYNLKKQK